MLYNVLSCEIRNNFLSIIIFNGIFFKSYIIYKYSFEEIYTLQSIYHLKYNLCICVIILISCPTMNKYIVPYGLFLYLTVAYIIL